MKNTTKIKTFFLIAVIAVIAVIGLKNSQAVFAQLTGAIYTTINDGTGVDENNYYAKEDVYLNGGPQNDNGPGLPDGTYYYQVTDPSGATLLSTDMAVCRQLVVIGGRISGSTPLSEPCRHANGILNPANNSIPVQLFPFNDTPNNGGVYKVWLVRQANTTIVAPDGIHINFNNNNSKTDNFRIRDFCEVHPDDPTCDPNPPDVTLSGHKFYDANANAFDDDGQVVAGVQIVISYTTPAGSFGPFVVTTDASGNWSYGPIPAGASFTVSENVPCVDENADMMCDVVNYWVQTAPVADGNGFQGYTGVANTNVTGLNFGDVCFHPATGGKTLGYWSNKNGQNTMNTGSVNIGVFPTQADNPAFPELGQGMNGDLNFLKRLNLKNSSLQKGTGNPLDFDPGNYPNFRTWLLNGNAVNMAYMLSVQLSATSLDCRHGFLSDSQIVDATGIGLGYQSIGAVRMGANTSLNDYSWTISGDPHRDSQEMMKNFLDGVNNNRLPFASATPCSVFYPPIIPATIIIIKDSQPNSVQPFSFTATGPGVSNFSLTDNGVVGPDRITFSGLSNFGAANSVSITEGIGVPYSLIQINCTSNPNGGSGIDNNTISVPSRNATIVLEAGEIVTCTFVNTL